ncbi:MAG: hypothetical protein AAB495_04020 [Patescibacteria group bacterium]
MRSEMGVGEMMTILKELDARRKMKRDILTVLEFLLERLDTDNIFPEKHNDGFSIPLRDGGYKWVVCKEHGDVRIKFFYPYRMSALGMQEKSRSKVLDVIGWKIEGRDLCDPKISYEILPALHESLRLLLFEVSKRSKAVGDAIERLLSGQAK